MTCFFFKKILKLVNRTGLAFYTASKINPITHFVNKCYNYRENLQSHKQSFTNKTFPQTARNLNQKTRNSISILLQRQCRWFRESLSLQCKNVNVMRLFNNTQRRKRSHGHRSYNELNIHDVSFDSLQLHVYKQLSLNNIPNKLYHVIFKLKIT